MVDTGAEVFLEVTTMGAEPAEVRTAEAEEVAIALAAGTCCTDPMPAIGPGCGILHYCEACDSELTPEVYAALRADPEGARRRIAQVRSERRTG